MYNSFSIIASYDKASQCLGPKLKGGRERSRKLERSPEIFFFSTMTATLYPPTSAWIWEAY